MGITKPCTHRHPPPSTSIQLSATPTTLLEPKYRTQLDNFPKFRPKNLKLSILTENWHTWYMGSADSESRLRFLKFRPQNSFLSKFGPKKSMLSFLLENWYKWYLEDADSYSDTNFLNFQPKIHFWANLDKKVKVAPENWHIWDLEDDDSYSYNSFLNLKTQFHFWTNVGRKNQSYHFFLKIDIQNILRMLILIPT